MLPVIMAAIRARLRNFLMGPGALPLAPAGTTAMRSEIRTQMRQNAAKQREPSGC
jgi:hypothetical protein